MSDLLLTNARVVRVALSHGPKSRAAMRDLCILPRAHLLLQHGSIAAIWSDDEPSPRLPSTLTTIDAKGRCVLPGFVDCHTHLCWAGSRIDEWTRLAAGETYQSIAASGGGIMSTVRAVRAAPISELVASLEHRIRAAISTGSTTIEIKSGYGLTLEHESRMLDAITTAAAASPATIIPTALLGHALDPAHTGGSEAFIADTIHNTLPSISRAHPGIALDAFCEKNAWSPEACQTLFERARALHHPIRVHTDQFTDLGMVARAVKLGARSVDHLEAASPETARLLSTSNTMAVILPCCGFHLDGRYADGRGLIDAGAKLALATNANPGSAPCSSMPMAIALAVRHTRLTPAEAISAATINAASVLNLPDRGYIAPGTRADLILLHDTDERSLAYGFGTNPVHTTIIAGKVTHLCS